MLAAHELFWFALAALVLGFTPGPNMAFCLSRALCQGRLAGLVSLAGVLAAYCVYVLTTALGLTVLVLTVPGALNAIAVAGAAYLLYLAWQALRLPLAGGLRLQRAHSMPVGTLFCAGFLTNLLNPKALLFYVALLPQFLQPERGALVTQSLQLGAVQIAMSGVVMGALVCGVSRLGPLMSDLRAGWRELPRYAMGSVFVALALRLLVVPVT